MKTLKVKSILFSLLVMMAITIFMTSCEQENIIIEDVVLRGQVSPLVAEYPAEITLDNWEQFIHAPQEVIDYHTEKERQLNQSRAIQSRNNICNPFVDNSGSPLTGNSIGPVTVNSTNPTSICNSGYLCGRVKAFDGQWRSIPGVSITMSQCITNSCGVRGRNFSLADDCGSILCMDYPTDALDGLSNLDKVLIGQHIENVTPFTTARQFIAADVNRDGIIDNDDITAIQETLAFTGNWANSEDIVFVTFGDYNDVQGEINQSNNVDSLFLRSVGTTSPCLSKFYENRRAIKTGDVNGTFEF